MIRLFFKQILNTRKKILFSIILFLTTLNISAQLSEQEQKEVVKRAKKVISEYETKINNLGKDIKSIDKTKIHKSELISLFVDRKCISPPKNQTKV